MLQTHYDGGRLYQWVNGKPEKGTLVVVPRTTPGHDVKDVGKLTTIRRVGSEVCKRSDDDYYVWIELQPGQGVWASHLLGYRLADITRFKWTSNITDIDRFADGRIRVTYANGKKKYFKHRAGK